MTINIHLHKEIVNSLRCFGDLSTVVNRILQAGADGLIDIMDKDACPDKEGCEHCRIDVTESNYLELYTTYGPKNRRISLRRLLYWFVENEIYDELGWQTINTEIVDKRAILFEKKLNTAVTELTRAISYSSSTSVKNKLAAIISQIGELQ